MSSPAKNPMATVASAMVRVVPAPSSVREKMSRPIWSQPKMWLRLGPAYLLAALMAVGS